MTVATLSRVTEPISQRKVLYNLQCGKVRSIIGITEVLTFPNSPHIRLVIFIQQCDMVQSEF